MPLSLSGDSTVKFPGRQAAFQQHRTRQYDEADQPSVYRPRNHYACIWARGNVADVHTASIFRLVPCGNTDVTPGYAKKRHC
jgi:hypothetical protein